jgi:hypothetical protein
MALLELLEHVVYPGFPGYGYSRIRENPDTQHVLTVQTGVDYSTLTLVEVRIDTPFY